MIPARPRPSLACLLLGLILSFPASASHAQVVGTGAVNAPPGVYIDADGNVKVRELDITQDLTQMRVRTRAAEAVSKQEKFSYVSLPRLFASVRSIRDSGKTIPENLQFFGGITQIRYVFVYPDRHDLVIAGPAEPWTTDKDGMYAWGTKSGRPVLQLDDLVMAMRTAEDGRGQLFGCGIDPSPESVKKAEIVAREMAAATRGERLAALQQALGPQKVRVFGTAEDTRFAFICVAADYELKRFAMGLHRSPILGMGNAVSGTRSAANKFWFETSYEPILVSADGNAYGLRGQRLAVHNGMFDFDPRGATPKATAWAKQFSQNIPALAMAVPLFAELQNIADEAVVANLIRVDRLDQKVGWGRSDILDDKTCPVKRIPIPRTADTLVNATNGSLVAGGVMLEVGPIVEGERAKDEKNTLDPARKQEQGAGGQQAVYGAGKE